MKISFQDHESLSVLTLSGEFTHDDTEAFNRVANEREARGTKHMVLDCSNLEFVDSKALESLLRLQERLGGAGGQLRLVKPDETVTQILRLTRLDLALESHPTLETAVRSLR
ncbi:MAG: STAS domain-containing protein [Phycisphaerales bacterium]